MQTAIPDLDNALIDGLTKGEVTVVAGATCSGKSRMLTRLCANLADQGNNILYITLEETEEHVTAGIRFIRPNTSAKQLSKSIHIKRLPVGISVDDIKACVIEYETCSKRTVDVIMIDGLDLMKRPVTSKRVPVVKKHELIVELKNYAVAYDRVCIGTTQLCREASDIDRVLHQNNAADHVLVIDSNELHYLRGTGKVGSIINLATVV